MVTEAARFVRAIKEGDKPYWLSLLGTSGAGKTYLSKRIYGWHCNQPQFDVGNFESGEEVVLARDWVNWSVFAAELQANSGRGRLAELKEAKFVVIDEIGADRDPNGHVRDCLARLCSARVGKWTVITSNRSLDAISSTIDQRVASRMIRDGSVVVDVDMPDYALRTPKTPHIQS